LICSDIKYRKKKVSLRRSLDEEKESKIVFTKEDEPLKLIDFSGKI